MSTPVEETSPAAPAVADKDAPPLGSRPFRCTICPARRHSCFTTEFNLDIHIRHIHKGEPIVCLVCNRHFNSAENLNSHMLSHSADRPFACTLCDNRSKTRGALKEHYKLHKGLRFKCSLCAKDFRLLATCKVHEQKHTSKATGLNAAKTGLRFRCDTCGKMFNQRCVLVAHMRTHTGERPYVCSVCGRAFADKTNMLKHMRIHTGERPYKCDECGKTFLQNSALTHHRRSHDTYKPHACEKCGKLMHTKEELIGHLRKVHGDDVRFQCTYCEQEFNEHAHLKSHMKFHLHKETAAKKEWVIKEDVDLNDESIYLKNGEVYSRRKPKRKRRTVREVLEAMNTKMNPLRKADDNVSSDEWNDEKVDDDTYFSDVPTNEDHRNDSDSNCSADVPSGANKGIKESREEIKPSSKPAAATNSLLSSFLMRFKSHFKDDPILQQFDFTSNNLSEPSVSFQISFKT